jgi:hypothetical protein
MKTALSAILLIGMTAGAWIHAFFQAPPPPQRFPELEFFKAGEIVPVYIAAASGAVLRFTTDTVGWHDRDMWEVRPVKARNDDIGDGDYTIAGLFRAERLSDADWVIEDGRMNMFVGCPADMRQRADKDDHCDDRASAFHDLVPHHRWWMHGEGGE